MALGGWEGTEGIYEVPTVCQEIEFYLFTLANIEVDVIIPIVQVTKLRLREFKWLLPQGPRTGKLTEGISYLFK